ncbi:MAG: hypothetical protein IT440_13600 [Phycisphaeraceae bacterium]|nr:hypothetical protein [Phycisphaeraceae bacterium]
MDLQLPDDFKEFLKLLSGNRVEYLLIGGYAVGYHGYPRATQDLNIWIAMRPDNAQRVVEALRSFGFDVPSLSADLFLETRSLVRLGSPPLRIEICTAISGVSFDACYAHRVIDSIDGVLVPILTRDDLIANKRASARHKDLDDLEHLQQ